MDKELIKWIAEVDQSRAAAREIILGLPPSEVAALMRAAARGEVFDDEETRVLIGSLACIGVASLLILET